jgi:hypothetical protein
MWSNFAVSHEKLENFSAKNKDILDKVPDGIHELLSLHVFYAKVLRGVRGESLFIDGRDEHLAYPNENATILPSIAEEDMTPLQQDDRIIRISRGFLTPTFLDLSKYGAIKHVGAPRYEVFRRGTEIGDVMIEDGYNSCDENEPDLSNCVSMENEEGCGVIYELKSVVYGSEGKRTMNELLTRRFKVICEYAYSEEIKNGYSFFLTDQSDQPGLCVYEINEGNINTFIENIIKKTDELLP